MYFCLNVLSLASLTRSYSNMYIHGCYNGSNLVKPSVQRQQILTEPSRTHCSFILYISEYRGCAPLHPTQAWI